MDNSGCWNSKQHEKNKSLAWSESRLMIGDGLMTSGIIGGNGSDVLRLR